MHKDDAQAILKSANAPANFKAWRDKRYQAGEKVDLSGLDLSGLELNEIDLSNTILRDAKFTGTKLGSVNFHNSDLTGANLDGCEIGNGNFKNAVLVEASVNSCYLQVADFSNADCSSANFIKSNLKGIKLHRTKLESTNLTGADLEGADIKHLSMNGVDLHGVKNVDIAKYPGLILDGHNVETWRFSPSCKDTWSVLRRRYTGVMTTFHLILFALALGPYIPRALKSYAGGDTLGYRRIELLLGYDTGKLVFMTSVVLLSYNFLRLILTWWLSQLRDIEERTSYAPKSKDYWWCWVLEKYFLQWVAWVAILISVVRTLRWLWEYV